MSILDVFCAHVVDAIICTALAEHTSKRLAAHATGRGIASTRVGTGGDPNAGHSLHWVLKRCYDQTDESRYPSFGYDSRTLSMDWKRARSWTVSASSTQFDDSWSDWPRLDEVMMMLIEGGLTGVDGLDGDGLTPLIVAVINGWPAAVQLLQLFLDSSVSVSVRLGFRQTGC